MSTGTGYCGTNLVDSASSTLSSPRTNSWIETLRLPRLQGRARFYTPAGEPLVLQMDSSGPIQPDCVGLIGVLPDGAPFNAFFHVKVEVRQMFTSTYFTVYDGAVSDLRWGPSRIVCWSGVLCDSVRVTVQNNWGNGFVDVLRFFVGQLELDPDSIDADFSIDQQPPNPATQSDGIAAYSQYTPARRVLRGNRTDLSQELAFGAGGSLQRAALQSVRNGDAIIVIEKGTSDNDEAYDLAFYGSFTQLPNIRSEGSGFFSNSFEFTEITPPKA